MAGRIYHWKHGWIPLDSYARGGESTGKPTSPPAALARARKRQQAWASAQQKIPMPSDVKSRQVGGFRVTTVNGFPSVYFKEVLELDKRPPEQYREIAKAASDVLRRYPRATVDNPVEIGFSSEMESGVMADTNNSSSHKIRLNTSMWDYPTRTTAQIAEMRSRNWGVFAKAPDLATFRREVLTHEIGHVLHMRDEDANKSNGEFTLTTISKGAIDKFTDEKVTPRQAGWTKTDRTNPTPDNFPQPSRVNIDLDILDQPTARWQVDSLNRQSVYALSSKYEFFAEAFLDGTVNGDKASETGKRAVALMTKLFGPGGKST